MKEVNIPLPHINNDEPVEIKVSIGEEKKEINFKVVSFIWETDEELSIYQDVTSISLARINRLKKTIENYDNSWELIQIFAPLENSKFLRVLYREKI